MNKNAKHYIADESIGGIEREYVEVERKADVGDRVVCTDTAHHLIGDIYTVKYFDSDGDINVEETVSIYIKEGQYKTLEPTDIVRIDGNRYRLVDRHAEVGEKVLIVDAECAYGMYENGDVIEVEREDELGIYNSSLIYDESNVNGLNSEGYVYEEEYLVLESLKPVEAEPLTVDETQASPQVIAMLANLARRVTQLEAQLRDTQRNVETFAQQTESNSEDIRLLDERTTCDCTSKSGAELLAEAFGALSRYEKRGDRQCGK